MEVVCSSEILVTTCNTNRYHNMKRKINMFTTSSQSNGINLKINYLVCLIVLFGLLHSINWEWWGGGGGGKHIKPVRFNIVIKSNPEQVWAALGAQHVTTVSQLSVCSNHLRAQHVFQPSQSAACFPTNSELSMYSNHLRGQHVFPPSQSSACVPTVSELSMCSNHLTVQHVFQLSQVQKKKIYSQG
jgi:hypothetical protein